MHDILNSTSGQEISDFHEANGKLDDTNRKKLVNLITEHIFSKESTLKIGDIENLAGQIILLFPTESKANIEYFVVKLYYIFFLLGFVLLSAREWNTTIWDFI